MLQQSIPLGLQDAVQERPRMSVSSSAPPLSLLGAARRCAIREMALAPGCKCCESLLQHILLCLGSTLFYDDDPNRLWQSLARKERSLITPRLLAACIVLQGRERQDLYPAPSPPAWPALYLFVAPTLSTNLIEGPAGARPGASTPATAEDLLATIQRLIADTRQRSELNKNERLERTVAYLWAAADSLEGRGE